MAVGSGGCVSVGTGPGPVGVAWDVGLLVGGPSGWVAGTVGAAADVGILVDFGSAVTAADGGSFDAEFEAGAEVAGDPESCWTCVAVLWSGAGSGLEQATALMSSVARVRARASLRLEVVGHGNLDMVLLSLLALGYVFLSGVGIRLAAVGIGGLWILW